MATPLPLTPDTRASSDNGSEDGTPIELPAYLREGAFSLDGAFVDFRMGMEDLRRDVAGMKELEMYDDFDDQDLVDISQVNPQLVREEVEYLTSLRTVEATQIDELTLLREREIKILHNRAINHILIESDRMDNEYHRLLTRTKEQERRSRESVYRRWQANEDTLVKHQLNSGGVLRRIDHSHKWVAEWDHAPQAILISIHALRNVKEKLGSGRFVLHLEMHDVLGGNNIAFINREVDECQANTRPVHHLGKYYTHDMVIDQTVRMVCPPAAVLRSHVVLAWEMWRLESGKYDPLDRMVASGAWPLVDGSFNVQHGDFKTHMSVGSSKLKQYDTFSAMQKDLQTDLSTHAGTLYFSVWEDRERDLAPAAEKVSLAATRSGSRSHSTTNAAWGTQLAAQRLSDNQQWMEGKRTSVDDNGPRDAGESPVAAPGAASLGGSVLRRRKISEASSGARATTPGRRARIGSSPAAGPDRASEGGSTGDGGGTYGDLLAHLDDEIGDAATPSPPRPQGGGGTPTARKKKVSLAPEVDGDDEAAAQQQQQPHGGGEDGPRTNPLLPDVPGPDRKVRIYTGGQVTLPGMHEASRTGAPILSKHSFLTDLKPPAPTANTLAKNHSKAVSAMLSVVPRKIRKAASGGGSKGADNKETVHYMQVVGEKMGHWRKVQTAELQASLRGDEDLDAGEEDAQDFIPGNEEQLEATMDSKALVAAADKLPVLKKLQYAQQTTATLNKTQVTTAAALNSSMFHFSVTGRREFVKVRRFFREKIPFLQSVIFFDTGVNPAGRWDMLRVFNAVLIFLIMLHLGMYMHQFGLWLHFNWYEVYFTVGSWYPLAFNVDRESWSTLTPFVQLFAACAGQLCCLTLQVVLFFILAMIHSIFGSFPYQLSRGLFWYSFYCVIDPAVTLVIDVAKGRWVQGDLFVLYHMFDRENRAGFLGIFLAIALYFQMCMIALVLWYRFTVGYHLNGRIDDMFKRILSPENCFFTPYDTEVSKKELAAVVKEAENWRSEAGDVKKIVCEEANDVAVCLFRERLWVLLYLRRHYARAKPKRWLQVYLNNITLSRPERVRCVRNMGTHRLARDMWKHLERNNPTLMQSDDYLKTDKVHDNYYDQDYMRVRSGLKAKQADLEQQKYMLLRYFEPQTVRYPVDLVGVDDNADDIDDIDEVPTPEIIDAFRNGTEPEMPFSVRQVQLLADLIFFETNGSSKRLSHLKHYLGGDVGKDVERPLSLSKFSLRSRFLSCAVDPVRAGFVTIYIQQPGGHGGKRRVFRSFVLLPNGAMVEAMPSGYMFDPAVHTSDDPEYWIYRSLCRHAQLQEKIDRNSTESTPPLTPPAR